MARYDSAPRLPRRSEAWIGRCVVVAACLAASAAIGACGSGDGAASSGSGAGEKVTWRMGFQSEAGSLEDVWMSAFRDDLKASSHGRIIIKTFPAAALGPAETQLKQVRSGSLDGTLINSDIATTLAPEFGVFSLPYLFPSMKVADAAVEAEPGHEYLAAFDNYGLKGLTIQFHAFRDVMGDNPVHTPADLKGKKIRYQGSPTLRAFYTAYGADPVTVDPSEIMTAMKTGTVDAIDSVAWYNDSGHFYEAAKADSEIGAIASAFVVVVNKQGFDSLSSSDQKLVTDAAAAANAKLHAARDKANDDALKDFAAHGLQVVKTDQIDVSAFRAVAQKAGLQKASDADSQALLDATKQYVSSHGGS